MSIVSSETTNAISASTQSTPTLSPDRNSFKNVNQTNNDSSYFEKMNRTNNDSSPTLPKLTVERFDEKDVERLVEPNVRKPKEDFRLKKSGYIVRRERERYSARISMCARDPLNCRFTFN